MLKNNFKIAFRQLKRQQLFSAINIFGLALGIACCLLIALYIKEEISYDQHHPNVENLYRVSLDVNLNEWQGKGNCVPPVLPLALVEEIPEVTKAARLNIYFGNAGTNLVRKATDKENKFEDNFTYADPELFDLFHLPLIYGDKESILALPNTMVISEKKAKKYFPNQNPVGETLVLNDDENQTFKIVGVMENMPTTTHFYYDFILSMASLEDSRRVQWVANNYYAYVSLKDGVAPLQIAEKLNEFSLRNFTPAFLESQQLDLRTKEREGQFYRVHLQPVKDIHLYSEGYGPQLAANGDIRYVQLFGIIALFIFAIAIVNFVNLSTARSAKRAKEVGVRKVIGSAKSQLIAQFLTESVLTSFFAFVLGVFLAYATLPFFNKLAGKTLTIPFDALTFYLFFLLLMIFTGLLAGLYPAFYLSGFEPIKVLKGKLSTRSTNNWLQNTLVVGQFAIAMGLIISTIIVYQQLNFIQHKKIGFDKDQVLLIQDTYTLGDQLPTFRKALKEVPDVKNASLSSYLPLDGGRRNSMAFFKGKETGLQEQLYMQTWNVDEDYLNTLGMELKAGRNFLPTMATDSIAVILNEKAVKELGLSDPLGKQISSPFRDQPYTVIGIVEDFNFESLRGEVESLGLFLGLSNSIIAVKANTKNVDRLIAKTESLWHSFAPTQPFRYTFMDDQFSKMYVTENRVGQLFGIFSILAIFIACLGLFAMATFMTEQRTKEIGVRKVLGASILQIVFLLSRNFLLLVFFGLLIAAPIAWFQMGEWLDNFSYSIDLQWWVLLLSGFIVAAIAFITVSLQSLKAALANPINSLKTEI